MDKLTLIQAVSRLTSRLLRLHLTGLGGLCRWQFPYGRWVKMETGEKRDSISRSHAYQPLISIIMPVYNTPETLLRQAMDSVLKQSYAKWELCVADDASTKLHVRKLLEEYSASDERIKVVCREENGHIAVASNSALSLATGEFAAFLDHDDELAPDALHWLVAELNDHPGADILYSDEDRLDSCGRRFDPHFKPGWNPDLFYSQNYLCHLTAIRATLIGAAGGFRPGLEGAQDYDLLLRCLEKTEAAKIRHIPRILYHWRAGEGSTSRDLSAKSYAEQAGVKALAHHFSAKHPGCRVQSGLGATTYRVIYPLPSPPPKVSIIIPTRDGAALLRCCVESIRKITDYPDYEIIIADNGSVEPATFELFNELRNEARVLIMDLPGEFNNSRINNQAVQTAAGELLCLLNNDVEVIAPGWLEEMARHAMRPDVGAVGAKLYYPDGRIQHGGIVLGLLGIANPLHHFLPRRHCGYFGRLQVVQSVSAVTGACLTVRRDLYLAAGGLDEINLPVAFNDVDFCLRLAKSGYRTVWTPYAELIHNESSSRGKDKCGENLIRFERESAFMRDRWGTLLDNDPYYNPNLSLVHRDFRPVWPPRHGASSR